MNYTEIALKYFRSGFRPIPVDSSKRPYGKWGQYRDSMSEEDVKREFARDAHGIAILTGINGLEVIDVDEKYSLDGKLMLRYQRLNDDCGGKEGVPFTSLTVNETTSGGYHIFYRCDEIEGNQKLASRLATDAEQASGDKVKVLIETRGIGGYVLVPPSPGYEVQYGRMSDIPEISPYQRLLLHRAARMFDEVPKQEPSAPASVAKQFSDGLTPWDAYNDKHDGPEVLERHGWQRVYEDNDRIYYRRPGDTKAKTSGNWHKGKRLFICHSTSTQLEAERGYTAHGIMCALEHGGDWSACAKALYTAGYGDRQKPDPLPPAQHLAAQPDNPSAAGQQDKDDELLAFIKSTRFDIRQPYQEDEATLFLDVDGRKFKLGGPKMIGAVVGPQKASKTSVIAAIAASGMAGGESVLGFSLDMQGKSAVFFDTEQSAYFYKYTQEMIHRMAGKADNPASYAAYHMRRLTPAQRLRGIDLLIKQAKDVGLIVIDGIVDLCENFNSETESSKVIEHLMRWSDETGAMILTVLHLTKADGFMRGHLGTALQNKYDFGIQVTKDGDEQSFKVRCRDSRFAPFPGFEFTKDERGYPVYEGSPAKATPAFAPVPSATQFPAIQPRQADNDFIPF
jgi:hypothetical protein